MRVQRIRLAAAAMPLVATHFIFATAHAGEAVKSLPEVVVTASPFDAAETAQILAPARILAGDELRDKLGASLGETLGNEPGVSASAFGAAASRPVIRGLGGPRVRVMQNGMGVADVSAISEDHAVGADPASARQIEILRGPAALLYGSGAAGGLVNIVNDRIPTQLEPAPTGEVELRYGSADRSGALSFAADASVGKTGLHLDGSLRDAADYRIPGRAEAGNPASASGRLPNSATRPRSLGFGVSRIDDWGYAGVSLASLDNRYGVPSEEGARIDMKQFRVDIDGMLKQPFRGFEFARFRFSHSDYQHAEFVAGVAETDFSNKAQEMRLEFGHREIAGWRGSFGVHAEQSELAAVAREAGEPATVPPAKSRAQALFLVEERDFGAARLNAGARVESAQRDAVGGPSRNFTLASYSIGAAWTGVPGYSFGPTFSVAQRAPSVEELYSAGPHHATETFDRGDAGLRKESSRNIELSLQKIAGLVRWRVNLFHNRIGNFVYGRLSGASFDHEGNPGDELRERIFSQAGATIRGAEGEISYNLRGQGLSARAFADASRGRLDAGGGDLPLQPATRFGAEVGYRQGPWRSTASMIRAQRQERLAAFESATPAYTRLDASLAYTQHYARGQLTWFAMVKNLLDEDIRLSTSLLKDVAPLAGRSLIVGVRNRF